MANDRREELERICQHPDILMGFSDAGAHLRNMAHYNLNQGAYGVSVAANIMSRA